MNNDLFRYQEQGPTLLHMAQRDLRGFAAPRQSPHPAQSDGLQPNSKTNLIRNGLQPNSTYINDKVAHKSPRKSASANAMPKTKGESSRTHE